MSQILPPNLHKFSPCPQKREHKPFCSPFCWCAPLPWTSSKIDISLQTCSASFSTQMTQESAASSYSTSTFPFPSQIYLSTRLSQSFFIHIQLLIFLLFLQSCPLPFFWKCSFHLLNAFTYHKVADYYSSILIRLPLQKPWKCLLTYYMIFKCK